MSLSPKHHHHQVQLQLPSSSSSRFTVQLNSLLRVALLLLYYCFSFLFLGWQTTTGKSSVPKCSPGSDDADGVATTETDCQITIFPFAFLCILLPFFCFFAWQVKQLSTILAAFFTLPSFCRCKIVFYFVVFLIFACFLIFFNF